MILKTFCFFFFFLFLFLLVPLHGEAKSSLSSSCHFINPKRPVLALSGPVAHYLYHLGSLNEARAISLQVGINDEGAFKGEKIGGGLFLSGNTLLKYGKDSLIFVDKSQELRKNLKNLKEAKSLRIIEIETLHLDPFEAYRKVKKLVLPHLNVKAPRCFQKIKELDQKVLMIEKKSKYSKPFKGTYLFYMGPVSKIASLPYMIILNDGLVGFLLKNKKIVSYPAPKESAYIPWAQKELNRIRTHPKDFPRPLVHVGLAGVNRNKEKIDKFSFSKDFFQEIQKKNEILLNVGGGGALIPGISQVFLLQDMMKVFHEL